MCPMRSRPAVVGASTRTKTARLDGKLNDHFQDARRSAMMAVVQVPEQRHP
jgi:hypothetical protein